MAPTYGSGEWNIINKASYWFSEPARGDVVAIRLAGDRVAYLKRVIALPGETVRIEGGVTHVNGVRLEEPYLVYRGDWTYDETTLEADQYLVIGDNRGMPIEQHMMGKARRTRIIGEVLW